MVWRLTKEAERDLTEIARYTLGAFGAEQAMRYASLIEKGLDMLAEAPLRPSSRARDELAPAVRSMHLSHAAKNRHAASHIIYYHLVGDAHDVVVLRVLHERMEPRTRLVDAVRRDAKQERDK
ncbi:type II toxin-antitoxin system RelE/ParE family toxin [Mycoplana dimorpha]|uniref:Toxin ParE1/3/4 n=1 Tax=Mycoplana dimorpha TaxID=28320 RepID=A0A2T5BIE5_MYCDI|nr:type II toxin-antitoxin system RelE/ParE family toxin [Mycoplana dimorpha]PTM98749.1 toxin ParE1/3/4 [Mycoplana dimorpha]